MITEKEEQKRAIKFLKQRIDVCIENANIWDENDFDEEASQLREEQKHTETVLNLIQQLQKELEKKEYLYHKALSELVIADKKNIEKDKIIDEMAEWIFDKDYNENSLFIDRDDYYSNCIKQVKQYFKKKAEKEKC